MNRNNLMLRGVSHAIVSLIILIQLTGCSSILISRKQKVKFTTDNEKAEVYLEKEQIGTGETFTTKVEKKGCQQIVIQTPEHKDAYEVLVPFKLDPARPILAILSFGFFFYPGIYELAVQDSKFYLYEKEIKINSGNQLVNRTPTQKYIDLEAIKLNIENKEKDILYFDDVYYNGANNLIKDIETRENKYKTDLKKTEEKAAKTKSKAKNNKVILNQEGDGKKIEFDDTKFSDMVYKTLKKTGYTDTVNKVFQDNNNTIVIEGVIRKIHVFDIRTSWGSFTKSKVNISWFLKNTFGEVFDSLNVWSYSGNFAIKNGDYYKMYSDAVDFSYFSLLKDNNFSNYLKIDSNFSIKDPILQIKKPVKTIKEISDATSATVTIKRSDKGHGTGFAISHDGYILTNYHVIAGTVANKQDEIKVILSDGEEVPVKIVRFNKMRDIALLKVEHQFDMVFELSETKSFKKLMEVYTIGTPKSIELGQSVSIGLLSNERKSNNNHLLQVSMSINPGNSGGPLFDKSGALHGVVTSKLVGFATEGVGFAIPSFLIPSYLNISLQ